MEKSRPCRSKRSVLRSGESVTAVFVASVTVMVLFDGAAAQAAIKGRSIDTFDLDVCACDDTPLRIRNDATHSRLLCVHPKSRKENCNKNGKGESGGRAVHSVSPVGSK